MIMPTLVRVRKNSSSSSIAINGAGMLPFITPTSMIGRGSTCPSMGAPPVPDPLLASTFGTSPTAPLYPNLAKAAWMQGAFVQFEVSTVVAGSPGSSGVAPAYTILKAVGDFVPGRPFAMSAIPDNGPKENMYVCVPSPIVAKPSPPEICWHFMAPFTLAGLVGNPDVPV